MKQVLFDVFISILYLCASIVLICCLLVVCDATIHELSQTEVHCSHHIHT